MSGGSVSPSYHRGFAYRVPDPALAELSINDNDYGANSAPNTAPPFVAPISSGRSSILGSAVKMSDPTREEIKAEIAAAEARGDTKIARMEGKLDLVLSKLDHSNEYFTQVRTDIADSRRAGIANAWVIFGALVVVIGILVTVAPVIFDMGFKWRETITKEVQDRIPATPTAKNSK
jgi:hypothetical protein